MRTMCNDDYISKICGKHNLAFKMTLMSTDFA